MANTTFFLSSTCYDLSKVRNEIESFLVSHKIRVLNSDLTFQIEEAVQYSSFPTGYRDLDIEILNRMDDLSFGRMCSTSKEVNKICNDPLLWERRLRLYYPDKFIDKPVKTTFTS